MNFVFTITAALGLGFILTFSEPSLNLQEVEKTTIQSDLTDTSVVYSSKNLVIKKLTNHIYIHISFLNTNDFGKVSCNGMLVINQGEAIILDSPVDNQSSTELIQFVNQKLRSKIIALIPTHFHQDCIGGLEKFEANNIPIHATKKTIALMKQKGVKFSKPVRSFSDELTLQIGNKKVHAGYFGEGHTKDNIVGYFPFENVLFGGCLIKEVGAGKGNLADANIIQWPKTVEKLKSTFPDAQIVIPGHGKWGGIDLLDYTIDLFSMSTD